MLKPEESPEESLLLYYDYYNCPIYYNQYEKNIETSGYIKLLHKNTERRPNLLFYPELTSYDMIALYIFPKIHEINNISYQGELVIEHISKTNQLGSLYVCIPLQTKQSMMTTTNIDKIIQNAKNPSHISSFDMMNLNTYITSTTSIVFKDKENTIVFFTSPIFVKNDFIQFTSIGNLFQQITIPFEKSEIRTLRHNAKDNTSYTKIVEGMDTYVDCYPIDDTGVDMATMLEVPLDSVAKNGDTGLVMAASYFLIFLVISILCYIVLPSIYNKFLVEIVKTNIKNITPIVALPTRLRSINFILAIYCIVVGFSCMIVGKGTYQINVPLFVSGEWILISTFIICMIFNFHEELLKIIEWNVISSGTSGASKNNTDNPFHVVDLDDVYVLLKQLWIQLFYNNENEFDLGLVFLTFSGFTLFFLLLFYTSTNVTLSVFVAATTNIFFVNGFYNYYRHNLDKLLGKPVPPTSLPP